MVPNQKKTETRYNKLLIFTLTTYYEDKHFNRVKELYLQNMPCLFMSYVLLERI